MRIYNKFGRAGTENLQITAMINDRSWGVNIEVDELLQMTRDHLRKSHPGKRIEILNISTKVGWDYGKEKEVDEARLSDLVCQSVVQQRQGAGQMAPGDDC